MSVGVLKKLMAAALVATLVTPVAAATAATPAAKKITVAQGKKIYDKAVKATNMWLKKTPHTTTWRYEDIAGDSRQLLTWSASIDRDGNLFTVDNGKEAYLIGETYYTEDDLGDFEEYELEIAEDLGLDLDARFTVMNPLIHDPEYPLDDIRAAYRAIDDAGFTGERPGAKTTTVTYRKTGSTEILTVTLTYGAKKGSPAAKIVLITKIERGIITSTTDVDTTDGETTRSTLTYKPFTGTIVAPAGPYFDYDKFYLDPRYGKPSDKTVAAATLYSFVREAQAIAAFDVLGKVTVETWKLVAEDEETMVVYDKGVEFSYSNGSKRACGVFTDEGATVELSTCAELGFTKL